MNKSIVKRIFGLVLCLGLCLGVLITSVNISEAKKSKKSKVSVKDITLSAETRDVRLSNGTSISATSYDEEYYVIGDHGFITFDSEDETIDVPPEYSSYQEDDKCAGVNISYEVENSSVVQIDAKSHTYTVVGGGESHVSMSAQLRIIDPEEADGFRTETWTADYCFIAIWDMTGAKLDATKVTTYVVYDSPGTADIEIVDCPDLTYYTFSYTSSNSSMYVSVDVDATGKALRISSYDAGKTTISVLLNGTQFDIVYTNKQVTINKDSYFMDKGNTVTLKVKGYSGDIKWYSMKKSIATVTQAGVVKGKKVGTTIIYTIVDGKRVGCAVSVLKKGMTKVVKKAIQVGKTCTYSQPKRMSKGYYDCSSLTWRAYKLIGKYFGDKSYAPVAASQAYWCVSRNKSLGKWTYKKVENLLYRPGDLLFRVGASNGRYKGVYHVEMFAGYRVVGFSGDKPYISMVWANRPDNYYEPCGDIIGRP